MFARREAHPTGELAPAAERVNVADRAERGGRGQKADAGNLDEALDDRVVRGEIRQAALKERHTLFDATDFFVEERQGLTEPAGQGGVGVFDERGHGGHGRAGTAGQEDALFAQEAPEGVDAGGTGRHPLGANPMQGHELLLSDGLDGDWDDPPLPYGLEQRLGVGAVGFVAAGIGPDVVGGQQRDPVPVALRDASPVVGGAARLHHDVAWRLIRKKTVELAAGEAVSRDQVLVRVRHGQFEDTLCEIDGNSRRIHGGLLSVR